jgi:non-heme chloroperoxidase
VVIKIIQDTENDRPEMLRGFGNMFFFQHVTQALSDWFLQLGLQAAGWSTAEIARTWLGEERLFEDLGKICVPTLIIHGIHDKVCFFPQAIAQNEAIPNSCLVPFKYNGHATFYDERNRFNEELCKFIES